MEYQRPIARELAIAIACEVTFRRSHWYDWTVSPAQKDRDRRQKPGHWERAELRRDYAIETLTNQIGSLA